MKIVWEASDIKMLMHLYHDGSSDEYIIAYIGGSDNAFLVSLLDGNTISSKKPMTKVEMADYLNINEYRPVSMRNQLKIIENQDDGIDREFSMKARSG